jgi:thiosulfate dehydrogenase
MRRTGKIITLVLFSALSIFWICVYAQKPALVQDKFQTPEKTDAAEISSPPAAVQQGKLLAMETRLRLPENVGNGLNCTSCHLDGGTKTNASSWIGIWGAFPEYSARHGKVISLQERINDCFVRSMNGRVLDINSVQMTNIVAYIRWLSEDNRLATRHGSRGFGKVNQNLNADLTRGKLVFVSRCASCHGVNGLGMGGAAGYVIPPLWGPDSFNDGAGMARTFTAAAFVKYNMPLGQGDALSDQEALDVAAYFTHQQRPVFSGKVRDWPNGGKPRDARN